MSQCWRSLRKSTECAAERAIAALLGGFWKDIDGNTPLHVHGSVLERSVVPWMVSSWFRRGGELRRKSGLRLDSPQATKNWGTIWENMLHVGHVPVDLSGTELSPRSRTMGHGAQQDCSSPLLLDHLLAHATR